VAVARRPALAPELVVKSFLRQAEARWQERLPTIERCCAPLQMILRQFARNSRFWYRIRSIAFAR
jgi:hypothetical protein